jgi:hypothetical protein
MDNYVSCPKPDSEFNLSIFYLSPISHGQFQLIVVIIYDEQTMIRMSMGRYSIYDRALAKYGIDYACISYGYNLKIRACRVYESENWRVDF